MTKRRRRHDEHANHEAWVIPYADLLTLLLALFVVLYAMSSVNTTKYRALAQAISAAFNGSHAVIRPLTPSAPQSSVPVPTDKPTPLPRTPLAQILLQQLTQQIRTPASNPAEPVDKNNNRFSDERQNLDRIRSEVERALKPLIDKNQVVIRRASNWLEIEIRTDILFPSGVATLSPSASQVLAGLGGILAPFANPLRVEGYTDDVPIDTSLYPSNWELSAARAASVARLFSEHGVDPERMGIVGWGQYRPAADNTSASGRNKNRRVLVVVLSDRAVPNRFYANMEQIRQTADTNIHDDDQRLGSSAPVPSSAAAASVSQPMTVVVPVAASTLGKISAVHLVRPMTVISMTRPRTGADTHSSGNDSKG